MSEAAFLLRTGWSPSDYDDAPDNLVRAVEILLRAQAEVSE